ncbi:MAG TPA: hypothetical protein PKI62_02800 [bacterium]|nr:hypothetical protein [bacterium]HPR87051.1 hypothetical protein [bacterium]
MTLRTCLLALAALLLPGLVDAATPGTVTAAASGQVVARPAAPDSVLATFKSGQLYPVLQVDAEWVKVALKSKRCGWVRRDLLQIPSPDSVTISRDWPLMQERGAAYRQADTSGAKSGRLRRGMRAQRLLIQGASYRIRLADGTSGWVHESRVEPAITEEIRADRSLYLLPDTVNRLPDSPGKIRIARGEKVIQLIRTTRWGKIRSSQGDEGWVWQAFLQHGDGVPSAANHILLYRIFKKLDDLRALHPIVSLLILAIQWLGLLLLPGVAVFALLYRSLGRVRALNNGLLKFLIAMAVIMTGLAFIGSFIPTIPPFLGGFSRTLAQFLAGAMLIGVIIGALDRVTEDRCPKCHRIGAGRIAGMHDAGTTRQTDTTTRYYQDGHRTVETDTIDTHSFTETRECRFCGQRWGISRSTRSRSRTLR